MDRLIYTSLAAVTEQRLVRSSLNNELANVSTPGFKRSFDVALKTMETAGPGFETRYQPRAVPIDRILLEAGPSISTGRPLDIALNDASVLTVEAPNGELAFTRRGDLRVGAGGVLENGAGHAVMGADGPITVPQGSYITVTEDGSVFARDPNDPAGENLQVGRLGLKDASAVRLERRADGLFRASAEDALPDGDFADGPMAPSLRSHTIEGSNVSPMTALVKMLDFSRSFELQVKIISEAKSLDEAGASMLRAAR